MTKHFLTVISILLFAFVTETTYGQQQPQRPGQPGARQGGARQGQPGAGGNSRILMLPIIAALDANKDGEISADEIKNATAALRKLDNDKDGKLSREEIMPQFGATGGRPGQPGAGGRAGGRGGQPGAGGRGGAGRPGQPGQPQPAPQGGFGPEQFIERMLAYDTNKDGKLDAKEVPERMVRMIERGDTNKDGVLDKKELETMAERFSQRPQGGNRPGGGQRPAPGGDRPAPPNRGQDLPERPTTK